MSEKLEDKQFILGDNPIDHEVIRALLAAKRQIDARQAAEATAQDDGAESDK